MPNKSMRVGISIPDANPALQYIVYAKLNSYFFCERFQRTVHEASEGLLMIVLQKVSIFGSCGRATDHR
jgi:hypothetical protein